MYRIESESESESKSESESESESGLCSVEHRASSVARRLVFALFTMEMPFEDVARSRAEKRESFVLAIHLSY
jgi:hypothetical protein